MTYQFGVLPSNQTPTIPSGDDIILYVHGGPGSRLEECGDLVKPLHDAGLRRGRRYTVVAFDQPSQGYSSMVDPDRVVPSHDAIGDYYPLVAFSEEFIVAFVNELDKITPIKNRNVYVIGGSTGGALTLRIGHRSEPWIGKIVAWSPACVWTTYSHDLLKGIALNTGFGRAKEAEDAGKRQDYFNNAFGQPAPDVQPNPEEWYRGNRNHYPGNQEPFSAEWPCKWDYIAAARIEQQEIYNPAYRRWHWRLGTELLIFSFFNDDWLGPANTAAGKKPANYESIHKPTLLSAAEDDDWNEGPGLHWENRWTRTQVMAKLMRDTPGSTLYLPDTGHSIHNERPVLFAERIAEFLSGASSGGGPLQIRPVFEQSQMPAEGCTPQLGRFPQIPRELLDNPDSSVFLMEPAKLGGRFSNGKTAGEYSLRLKQELRVVAAKSDPKLALAQAAVHMSYGDPANILLGNAFADLAVSGRAVYNAFRNHPPTAIEIADEARTLFPPAVNVDPNKLNNAIVAAQTRAYMSAWALRHPDPQEGYRFRPSLGWIAVSGEDDPPDRPVNVPSGIPMFGADGKTQIGCYPQYELAVTMFPAVWDKKKGLLPAYECSAGSQQGVTFQVRYTIASP
jgi:pimeloyl-ACP methyl ester carboxylesterase